MTKLSFLKASFSFNGKVKEFPGLCIDRCNADADICLISHCHKDHLSGLLNKSMHGKIYCSSLTKKLILQDPKYRSLKLILEPLTLNEIHTFRLRKAVISIALIPSYHCPGSVMFLVEGRNKSILYSGDIRGEKWWLEQLRENKILEKYIKGNSILNAVYLDTTFSYRDTRLIEIPSNHDSIDLITKIILCYPLDDPDVQFFFRDFTSGFEEVWQIITENFREHIHLSEELRSRAQCLESELPFFLKVNQTSIEDHTENACKFHACSSASCKESCKFPISIKRCVDFNAFDYTNSFFPISLENLCPEEFENHLTLVDRTEYGNLIFNFRRNTWLLNKDSNELLPCTIKFPFSGHSSFSECRNIVSLFKPLEVYPCTESRQTWEKGFTMAKYFGDLCRNSQQQTYDRIKEKEYGPQLALISKMPIKVINSWNVDDCIDIIKRWGDSLENSNSTNMASNKLLRSADMPQNHDENCHHDGTSRPTLSPHKGETFGNLEKLLLQKLIVERKNSKYTDFFKKQQWLYFRYYKASCLQEIWDFMGSYEKELSDTCRGPKIGGLDEYNYNSSNSLSEYDGLDIRNENDHILNKLSHAIPLRRSKNTRSHSNINSSVPRVLGLQLKETLSNFHNFFNVSCEIEEFNDSNCSTKRRKLTWAQNMSQIANSVEPLYINGNQSGSFKKISSAIPTKKVILKSSGALDLNNITRTCYELSQNPTFWCGMSLKSFGYTSFNKAFIPQGIAERTDMKREK